MCLLFDDFVFNEKTYELRKASSRLKLDAKLLKLLAYFLQHSGKTISKEDILEQVWEGRTRSDNIVSVGVAKLRKALGHKNGEREFIVTVFGHGYRFEMPVTSVGSTENKTPSSYGPRQQPVRKASLVGRDSVMKQLKSALEGAHEGLGKICVLVGEPGIGKTRVAEAFEACSTSKGTMWSWAHCHYMESSPPLWVWIQILREYLSTELADEIRRVLDEHANELTRLSERDDPVNEFAEGSSLAGQRTFDGIIQVLKKLSKKRTLVLILDDLHWADAASLKLLSYLVMKVARWPILVVGSFRTTEFDSEDKCHKDLSYVLSHGNCERIVLNRLTESDVGDYLAEIFGENDDQLSHAVFEKSEGNPFFMVELLRPWRYCKRPQPDELGFSELALDIVRQRIRKLEFETREILSVAAVIGRVFDLNMLSYMTEREETTLIDILDQQLADDTIVLSSNDPTRFAFGHDLICEVLYKELAVVERKSWHLRAGEYLERKKASGAEVVTAELAHHFLSALSEEHILKAVNYANKAAQEAWRFYAYSDAYTFLHRAIHVLESVESPDLQLLCNLLLYLSLSARGFGDNRFLDYINRVIKLATENGFGQILVMAGQQLNILPGIVAQPRALWVLESAERMLFEHEKKERSIALSHLAWTPPNCMNRGRIDELLTRAEQLARESNDILALNTVLRGKLFFAAGPANYPAAQAIADELEQSISSEQDLWVLSSINIQFFRIVSAIQRGNRYAVQKAIDDFGAFAQKSKAVELIWYYERVGIVQRMNAGELDGVSEALSELRQRAEGIGLESGQLLCHLDLQVLLSLTSDLRPFAAEFSGQLRFNELDSQGIWASKIQRMVEFGLLREAEDALRRIPVASIYDLPEDLYYLDTLTSLAEGSLATKAMEYVEALYQLLKPFPQYYAAGLSFHCSGSVSYFLGILARARDQRLKAVAHLEDALELNARFNLKTQVVRTRYELACTLANSMSQTEAKRARLLLQEVRRDAYKMGLQRLFDDAECMLASV